MATPYSVIRREVAPSTQDLARAAFAGTPVLVVADRQDSGRGRSGSTWENAPRAVAMSLAVGPRWARSHWSLIPLVAAISVSRTVGGDLKWPNDLIRAGSKTGGILVEVAGDGPVVVGVGLNLWWPDPPEGVGSVFDHDPGAGSSDRIAGEWAETTLAILATPPEQWPRQEYIERCVTIGAAITWEPSGSGVATGIAADGGLEVDTAHGRITIRSGQVHHIRGATR